MRYAIISKGLTLSQLQDEVKRYGGRNIKTAPMLKQVFCDLDKDALVKLQSVPGLVVKTMGKVKAPQVSVPRGYIEHPIISPGLTPHDLMYAQQPTYAASQVSLASQMYDLRAMLDPPMVGSGSTIVILDSGIRKTHRGLVDKVVYEKNCTGSGTVNDIFSHGTAVAYMAAGGRHAPGEESGIAPGAMLMNIKVLGDDGVGTDEEIVVGLEEVMELWEEAEAKGLPATDPMFPNILNMSWGKEDTGDEDDPIRVAVKAVYEAAPPGAVMYAAAGNYGPNPGTVTLPASMSEVIAIGALTFVPFQVWQYSSRGPTIEGLTKPEYSFFGVDLLLASSKEDDAFEMKSGTSFSCPAFAGFWALALEGAPRALPPEMASVMLLTPPPKWLQTFGPLVQAVCVKPADAPPGQDNDSGYGLPFGSLVISQYRAMASPMAGVVESLSPILAMGMMGMMIIPVTKGLASTTVS